MCMCFFALKNIIFDKITAILTDILDISFQYRLNVLESHYYTELQIEGVSAFLMQTKWAKTPTVSNRCVKKTPTETRIDAS